MQEKFALRKTLKKVAALGTSLAMVGVTLSGAFAAGLNDYSGFTKSSTVVVFGEAGTDSVAVSDVVAGLPGAAGATEGGTVAGALELTDFEDGESQDFEPGNQLNSTVAFGKRCFTDNDDVGLVEWEQNINIDRDKDYDVHEEFCFGNAVGAVPSMETALSKADDDFGIEPILNVPQNGLNYTLVFEEDIDANNRIANATTTKQITLTSFLGKTMKITGSVAAGNQLTALVGSEYELHSGDTATHEDCEVSVEAIDANEVLVSVNGVTKTINEDSNERYGDCEVHVDSAIETTDGEGVAVLFVGDQASESFKNGEHYAGEDEDHYLWEWQLNNLQGARPVMGVLMKENLDSDRTDLEDEIMDLGLLRSNRRHLKPGDYLCLPNMHECLIFEGPKVETNRCTIEFNADAQTENLPGIPSNHVGASATYQNAYIMNIEATGCGTDEGLKVDTNGDGTVDTDTDRVMLFWDGDLDTNPIGSKNVDNITFGEVLVYYENSNGNETITNVSTSSIGHDGADANASIGTEQLLFEIDNEDFDNAAVKLWDIVNSSFSTTASTGHMPFNMLSSSNNSIIAVLRLELDDEGGGVVDGSKPTLWFEAGFRSSTVTGIDRMGAQVGEDTTKYLRYAANASNANLGTTATNSSIAGFDQDVLALSGVILKDVEDNYDDDKLVFDVPNDDEFEWMVRVARPKAGVVSTTGTVVSSDVTMSDQEVSDVAGLNKDVVVVGGPAVNSVAAGLLGVDFPTYGSELAGLEEGTAVLEMKALANGKSALLVYGWEQDDTRRAAVLLRDPAVLTQKLADAGLTDADSATVTGTDFSVAGITVSA